MKYWYIGSDEFEDARECADYIMENCDNDYYDNMLDEVYGTVYICGYSYSASAAFYDVDPIAYQCGRNDWEDSEASGIEWELERMDNGEQSEFFGFVVECIEEEEEEEDTEE